MKFVIYATLATALMAIAGCTTDDGYDGCRGSGCLVDRPHKRDRKIDDRPQFDRNGNPNFDTRGRYIGCRGLGCKVDDPDDGIKASTTDRSTTRKAIPTSIPKATTKAAAASAARSMRQTMTGHRTTIVHRAMTIPIDGPCNEQGRG